jgi:hypothetical protein
MNKEPTTKYKMSALEGIKFQQVGWETHLWKATVTPPPAILHHEEMSCTPHWPYKWQESMSCALQKTCRLLLKYSIPSNIGSDVWRDWKRHIAHNHGLPHPRIHAIFQIHRNDVAMFHYLEASKSLYFFEFATSCNSKLRRRTILVTTTHDVHGIA